MRGTTFSSTCMLQQACNTPRCTTLPSQLQAAMMTKTQNSTRITPSETTSYAKSTTATHCISQSTDTNSAPKWFSKPS